jgi:D-amino-acid dehydrogenase
MKVLVLGAGVVGVTTAYELLQDGHEVVVLERESTPAQGASHANAGLLVPGAALAWGSPERLRSLPKVWLGLEQAMRIGFPGPHLISWGLRFLKECTTEAWRRNTLIRQRLSLYSQTVMAAVLAESGVKYDRRTGGVLSIFRDSRSLEHGNRLRDILREDGQKYELLDAAQLVKLEPAFANARTTLAGAILCPTDESGDCHGFTQNLAQICQARGAAFQFGVTARHFISDGNQVTKVATDHGEFSADAFVLCLGCWSPQLAGSLGETLSIYPVK